MPEGNVSQLLFGKAQNGLEINKDGHIDAQSEAFPNAEGTGAGQEREGQDPAAPFEGEGKSGRVGISQQEAQRVGKGSGGAEMGAGQAYESQATN